MIDQMDILLRFGLVFFTAIGQAICVGNRNWLTPYRCLVALKLVVKLINM